jgi:cytochrome P450
MKRQDPLEDFIRDNRASFDDLKAPAGLWSRIEKKDKPVINLWKMTAIAASALLLVAVGYIFGIRAQAKPQIAGWDEYMEAEQYYQSRIDTKMQEIKALPVSEEVMNDIQVLDEVYEQLRRQLTEDPNANTELLLSAMIRHQQQKLEVMEKILRLNAEDILQK